MLRRHYVATGLCFCLIGFLLRWFLLADLGNRVAFITFYPAIVFASLFAGFRAGLVATALSTILADLFWIEPVGTLYIASLADVVSILVFVASSLLVAYLAELRHRASVQLLELETEHARQLAAEVARTAAALDDSERRFKIALAGSPVAVWEQDLDLKYVWFWNSRFDAVGVVGKTDADLMDPDCVPMLEAIKRGVLASGKAARQTVEAAALGDAKGFFDLHVEPRLDEDQRVTGISCVAIDVTRQHRLENELRGLAETLDQRVKAEVAAHAQAQSRLAKLQLLGAIGENSEDAIYAKDVEGRFLYANPAVLAIIGKSSEQVIGRTDAQIHPDEVQAAAVMANDRRILRAGFPETVEETFDAAGLGTRTFRSAKSPFHSLDGDIAGLVCVSSDITELRTTESRLRELAATLERRVQAEVAAREKLQVRLGHARRMEAMGQLASGVAHDFNNVLAIAQSCGTLIEAHAGEESRVRRLAGMIVEAAERGALVTGRLLAFSRRADLRSEPIELGPLLDTLQEILSHTMGTGVSVETTVEADLPPLLADKGQLETVLVNLAHNARDAMHGKGTITISGKREQLQLEVGQATSLNLPTGAYVRIAVSDTGDGMSPEVLARAAEPFFTTKGPSQGTGLGLAMAHGFAEQSGGKLEIQSEEGRGTTVHLWFPVASTATVRPRGPNADSAVAAHPQAPAARLLVVDDDYLVMESTALQMEAKGYCALRAESAAWALEHLRSGEPIDLMITDLSMPGMDGLTLIEEARRLHPELPVIIATGYATKTFEQSLTQKLGSKYALLRKPFPGDVLANAVARLLTEAARLEA